MKKYKGTRLEGIALLSWFAIMVSLAVAHNTFPDFPPLDLHETQSEAVVHWKGERPIGTEALAALVEWERDLNYYGAFATGPDDRFGWVTGYNAPDMAAATAQAKCGTECQVVAVLAPFEAPDNDVIPLSRQAQGWLADLRKLPLGRALATAPSGEFGSAYNYYAQYQAQERALFECQRQLENRDPALPISTCRLIESEGTKVKGLLPPRPSPNLF